MNLIITFFSTLGALIVGFIIGVATSDPYKSKKTCRTCLKRIIEYGFHSEGGKYEVKLVEKSDSNGGNKKKT